MAYDHALLEFTSEGVSIEDQQTSSGYNYKLNQNLDEIKQIWCLIFKCTIVQKESIKNS